MRDPAQDALLLDAMRARSRSLAPEATGFPPRLTAMPGIRAVLFDVYGTLFISSSGDVGTVVRQDRGPALRAALETIGAVGDLDRASGEGAALWLEAIDREHARRRAEGCPSPEIEVRRTWVAVLFELRLRNLLREIPTADRIERLAVEFEARVNPVWPMPGAGETLRALAARGLPLGIVSNAQFFTPLLFPALLGADLEALGFDPDLCAWSWMLREAKPSPRLFEPVLSALQARGIGPGEVLYIGNDMLNDIKTAAQAGCRTVLFAGDRRSLRLRDDDPRCEGIRPDAVIDALPQLSGLLTGRSEDSA